MPSAPWAPGCSEAWWDTLSPRDAIADCLPHRPVDREARELIDNGADNRSVRRDDAGRSLDHEVQPAKATRAIGSVLMPRSPPRALACHLAVETLHLHAGGRFLGGDETAD